MHLFLIRHGETEHNVAGLLAGVTDSRLTNYGVSQTQRLGSSLVKDRGLRFTHVFSSDLQRAFMTANEICKAQNITQSTKPEIEVVKLEVLREQDFGSLELVSWSSRHAEPGLKSRTLTPESADFKPKETSESMKRRANAFLNDYIFQLLMFDRDEPTNIAVVSHGIFLGQLWRALLERFDAKRVTTGANITTIMTSQSIRFMSWSNTGCLEVNIETSHDKSESTDEPTPQKLDANIESPFANASMIIRSTNDKQHLSNLKRARGGIGSAAYDQRQQSLNGFFKVKKQRTNKPRKD